MYLSTTRENYSMKFRFQCINETARKIISKKSVSSRPGRLLLKRRKWIGKYVFLDFFFYRDVCLCNSTKKKNAPRYWYNEQTEKHVEIRTRVRARVFLRYVRVMYAISYVPGFAEDERHVLHVRHVYPGLLVNDVPPQFFYRALEFPAVYTVQCKKKETQQQRSLAF